MASWKDKETKAHVKAFKKSLIAVKTDVLRQSKKEQRKRIDQLKPLVHLNKIPEKFHAKAILENVDGYWSEDALLYTLNGKCMRLFVELGMRVDIVGYIDCKNNLLRIALDSGESKPVEAVCELYKKQNLLPNDFTTELPTKTKKILFETSWNPQVIARLYECSNRFIVPRGQEVCVKYMIAAYNSFPPSGNSGQPERTEAEEECTKIVSAFGENGFTVLNPKTEWTFDELLEHLSRSIDVIKENCSVLFICIMSHGRNGVIIDKTGKGGEINAVLNLLKVLPDHIPMVLLCQACQGKDTPDMQVEIRTRPIDGDQDADIRGSAFPTQASRETINTRIAAVDVPESQIKLKRPNTMVVTATAADYYATRHIFLEKLAEQIQKADGQTTFDSMLAHCSNAMARLPKREHRGQTPMTYKTFRHELILPKSKVYDKQVRNANTGLMSGFADMLSALGDMMKPGK